MIHHLLKPALLMGVLALVGCDSGATVTGRVTLTGQPTRAGGVTFHPNTGGPPATGIIGEDGRFSLVVGANGKLPPGDYKVTVVVYGEQKAVVPMNGNTPPAPPLLSDPRFNDLAKTPLVATVKAGANDFTFDVGPPEKGAKAP